MKKAKEEKEYQQRLAVDAIPETGFRVGLSNEEGNGYVGEIFMGQNEKPVKVIFDTGSDFLAVTSSLCNDQSLGQVEEDVPVFDPV